MPESSDEPGSRTCFIVGPIDSALDPRGTPGRDAYEQAIQMWEEVFEPACEALELQPVRADKIAETGEIPEQIFLYLRDSPVVIADVTDGNPNVMYELGLRHTRDLITIQVGEHQRLPFDIASIRTVKFKRTAGGLVELRDSLIEALRVALDGGGQPIAATRVWNGLAELDSANVAAAVKLSSEPDKSGTAEEPGFMDVLAEGECAILEVAGHLTRLGEFMVATSALAQDAQARVAESDVRHGGFAGRLQVARSLATQLAGPVDAMDRVAE